MTSTPSSHKSSYKIVLYSSVISTSLPRVITTQGSWPKQKKSHFFFAGKTSDLSPVCTLVFPSGSHIRKNTIVKGAVWTFTTLKSPYLGFLATCQLKKTQHTHTNHPQYSTCHIMFSEPFFLKKAILGIFEPICHRSKHPSTTFYEISYQKTEQNPTWKWEGGGEGNSNQIITKATKSDRLKVWKQLII